LRRLCSVLGTAADRGETAVTDNLKKMAAARRRFRRRRHFRRRFGAGSGAAEGFARGRF
jgi:hypothetical protein